MRTKKSLKYWTIQYDSDSWDSKVLEPKNKAELIFVIIKVAIEAVLWILTYKYMDKQTILWYSFISWKYE